MATTIAQNSIETVSRLIRNEFDSYNQPWQLNSAREMITVARDFGLHELANEMQNDL